MATDSSFTPRGRRGQVQKWASFGVVIAISVVAFVVIAILLGAFKTTSLACPSAYTFNSTANNCYSNSNASVTSALTAAGNITDNSLLFIGNTTGQLGTAGTILGVSLLLVIIAGVGFAGYTMYQRSR